MSGKNTMPNDVAVIIPSYCPDDRLLSTVKELISVEAQNIVVVNDESGKEYDGVFAEISSHPVCTVIDHYENRGRGASIKSGIAFCLEELPSLRAVVIADGEGHHKCSDIVTCAHKTVDSGCVVFGVRDKNDRTISPKGRYGNMITSAAISFLCKFDISDPLTSLRGIGAKYLPELLKTKGDRYDYETNMILDLSRKSIPHKQFRIVGEYYADGKRSHFRPLRDGFRIAIEILKYFTQQFKYALSSMICYLTEYLLYRLILAYLPIFSIRITNYLCRLVAGTLNFTINKKVVFKSDKNNIRTALKYIAVQIFVLLASTEMIALVNAAFLTENDTVAKYIKIPIDIVLFFVGYFLQKKWVFASKKKG